jgi:solute carrier family 34 (sodium-dependent phosphate cotransporter)
MFFVAGLLLFTALACLIIYLKRLLLGNFTRVIYKATNMNGYIGIVIGCGITMIIQSSSVTTSVLTPVVGVGLLKLEDMYALTLGANIGTTATALLASTVSDSILSVQVALAHLFFNVTGVSIWYPVPFMRNVILGLARGLGRGTRIWVGFPFVYIAVTFFIVPLVLVGVSTMFQKKQKGLTVIGSFFVAFIVLFAVSTAFVCKYRGGRDRCMKTMKVTERRRRAVRDLPDDMDYLLETVVELKSKVRALVEYTGLPDDFEATHEVPAVVGLSTESNAHSVISDR